MRVKKKPQEKIELAWVRCQVGQPIHELAKYIRDRLGLANVPMAYTYLIHFAYWGKSPEAVAQEMAQSAGLKLPSLEPEQLVMEEITDGTEN